MMLAVCVLVVQGTEVQLAALDDAPVECDVSLLQTKLDHDYDYYDYAKIVSYVKQVHDQKMVPSVFGTLMECYDTLYPSATGPKTYHRDVQRCIGTQHRLMLANMMDSSEPEPTVALAVSNGHVIDQQVDLFENAYPIKDVIDGIASYSCVHFMDLENMIRAKTGASPESFDPDNIKQHWKPIADNMFKAWSELYSSPDLADPFQALAIMASIHTFMVNDALAASRVPFTPM